MQEINLSQLNRAYLSQNTQSAPIQEPVKEEKQVKNGKKKIKLALECLGAIGAAALIGVAIYKCKGTPKPQGGNTSPAKLLSEIDFDKGTASLKGSSEKFSGTIQDVMKNGDKITLEYKDGILQSSTRSGSVNFKKVYKTVNNERIVEKTVNGITTESNLTQMQKAAKKVKLHKVESLGNGKIRVCFKKGNVISSPIELPEYLYHVTSAKAMDSITSSGALKTSTHEQLTGVYLLDGENFFQRYPQTNINGKPRDFFSAIFRQANRGNTGVNLEDQELVVLKIPTKDLLESGKLRIRTQEDFFHFNDKIKELSKQMGKDFNLRQLCEDSKRLEFRNLLISQKLMTETEADSFIADMTQRIHRGYSIKDASSLSTDHAVEYIFNHDINLSEFPNMTMRKFTLADYATPNSRNKRFAPANLHSLFYDAAGYKKVA